MGFCGYYRKFIQNFSRLAKCLHKLTEKGRKFEWTNECQSAFEELKHHPDKSDICPIATLLVLFPSISQMLLELLLVQMA
jgi:hypothetical protein